MTAVLAVYTNIKYVVFSMCTYEAGKQLVILIAVIYPSSNAYCTVTSARARTHVLLPHTIDFGHGG